MSQTTTNHRQTKMLNNRIKERQHFQGNFNFDSSNVIAALGGQTIKKRPFWITEPITPKDKHFGNSMNPEDNEKESILQKRMQEIKQNRFAIQQSRSVENLLENSKNGRYPTQQNFQNQQSINLGQNLGGSSSLVQFKITTRKFGNNEKEQSFSQTPKNSSFGQNLSKLANVMSSTYSNFFQNPYRRQQQEPDNIGISQPDFYKSALPKNLNINYKQMAAGYEKECFSYQPPLAINSRQWSPEKNYSRKHIVTQNRWNTQRNNKAYY